MPLCWYFCCCVETVVKLQVHSVYIQLLNGEATAPGDGMQRHLSHLSVVADAAAMHLHWERSSNSTGDCSITSVTCLFHAVVAVAAAMHLHWERSSNSTGDCSITSLTWMGKVPEEIPEVRESL